MQQIKKVFDKILTKYKIGEAISIKVHKMFEKKRVQLFFLTLFFFLTLVPSFSHVKYDFITSNTFYNCDKSKSEKFFLEILYKFSI